MRRGVQGPYLGTSVGNSFTRFTQIGRDKERAFWGKLSKPWKWGAHPDCYLACNKESHSLPYRFLFLDEHY